MFTEGRPHGSRACAEATGAGRAGSQAYSPTLEMLRWWVFRFQGDKGIWLVAILLGLVSILAVYSASTSLAFRFRGGDVNHYLQKHVILLGLGFVIMYVVHRLDYRWFAKAAFPLILMTVALLAMVLVMGGGANYREARWLSLGGVSFQPSDLAKFSMVVYLARLLTRQQEVIKDLTRGFLPAISWVLIICGIIAPTNLSTALLIFAVSLLLMFVAGVSLKHMGAFLGIGVVGLIALVSTAERASTWRSRVDDYFSSWTDPAYEPNYQTQQANVAIATGGWLGKGAGKSLQRHYLPESYSDFVFAILVEEYGLMGGAVLVVLYVLLLVRSVAIVTVSRTFGALLAAGLSFLITLQALLNMGVTVGILPVTGQPLPLISMGGTSILFTCLSLGVILSISREVTSGAVPHLKPQAA